MMEAQPKLFAVQSSVGGTTFMLVNAVDGLSALDAYCVSQGVGAYSTHDLDELSEYVYELPEDDYVHATFSNYEIVAVPVTEPIHATGMDKNGVAVMDAAGLCLTDGWPSAEEALAHVAAAETAPRSPYSQPEFFNEENATPAERQAHFYGDTSGEAMGR